MVKNKNMVLPHVFIINLPERPERRQHMVDLMSKLSISDYEFVVPIKVNDWNATVTENEMSLIQTILHIFNLAKEREYSTFLVFEDDIVIKQPPLWIVNKIELAIDSLPKDGWDMLHFEYCFELCEKVQPYNDHLLSSSRPLCTAAILYNLNSIEKIKNCIDFEQLNLDKSYVACFKKDNLHGFLCNPPIFFQDETFETDIQNTLMKRLKQTFYTKGNICKSNLLYSIKWLNIILILMCILIIVSIVLYAIYHC
jgi:hypothetical protein